MNTLIAGYLDLARSFKVEEPEKVELAQALREIASRTGGVRVEAQPCTVRIGRQALARILSNLLENARRYGGGEIGLRLVRDKNWVRIQVLDKGPGIPEEELDKVFRPFYRLDVSRAKTTGGTGLGLAIVKQLAEANGWKIRLRNRPQGGLEAELEIQDNALDVLPNVDPGNGSNAVPQRALTGSTWTGARFGPGNNPRPDG